MRIWILSLLAVLTAAVVMAANDRVPLRIEAEPYPSHGLPAVAPAVRVTLTNEGSDPLRYTKAYVCLEVTPPTGESFGCSTADYADYTALPFGPLASPISAAEFRLPAHDSITFFIGPRNTSIFSGRWMLKPGKYAFRVRFQLTGASSAPATYVIDEPQDENRLVWQRMLDIANADESTETFAFALDERMQAVYTAHPTSEYAKLARIEQDALTHNNPSSMAGEIEQIQGYLASGVPAPYDDELRLGLAGEYEKWAQELAFAGKFPEAGEKASIGAAMLRTLIAGRSPFAAVNAKALLDHGLWTEGDLRKALEPARPKASHARVDCIAINNDGTFTAWFGYDNPNKGLYDIAVGANNHFEPAPENRGQPTLFDVGAKEHVFSVTAPVGEKLVWVLEGTRATASANEGIRHCDDKPGQGQ